MNLSRLLITNALAFHALRGYSDLNAPVVKSVLSSPVLKCEGSFDSAQDRRGGTRPLGITHPRPLIAIKGR